MAEALPLIEKPLINKYRPEQWHQLIGHEEMVASLSRAMKAGSHPHAYLLTGPSGIGKTTIARIIANDLNADVIEVDAASNSGVDAMRALVELGEYVPFGVSRRMIIIDECHALSRSAFQAVLKILEEPPEHLYLALCTTELGRIPETIQTRCFHVKLNRVRDRDIEDLLIYVCGKEDWQVENDVLDEVILASTGQPRKALSILQAVYGAKDREEVGRIIALIDRKEAVGELGQAILSGKKWDIIRPILVSISDDDFEQTKIGLCRYLIGALLKEENPSRAKGIWQLIEALVYPSSSFDPKANFIAAVGRILFA